MSFNDLPTELLQKIFYFLPIRDKFRSERVCRRWQQNLFHSVQCLATEDYEDVFRGEHEHAPIAQNFLPQKLNNDEEAMKCIVSKCGENLRCFRGKVTYSTMLVIAKHCRTLHCIDMYFDALESLVLLGEVFGKHLTCVTLYVNLLSDIIPLASVCPRLTSLAVIAPHDQESRLSREPVELFELEPKTYEIPSSMKSLKNLVVAPNVSQETLKRLKHLTELKKAAIYVSYDLNKSALWKSVLMTWSGLRSLTIEVDSSNYIHFNPLPPNLEFLSLRCHTYIPGSSFGEDPGAMQFTTFLPKLQTLKIYQREITQGNIRVLVNTLCKNCPSLTELLLTSSMCPKYNADDALTALLSLSSLKKLSFGNQFLISDEFYSRLVSDLPNLTSVGSSECLEKNGRGFRCNRTLIPSSPLFWDTLRNKATAFPSMQFSVIGDVVGSFTLHPLLPSNVTLSLFVGGSPELAFCEYSIQRQISDLQIWNSRQLDQEHRINIKLLSATNQSVLGLPSDVESLTVLCISERAEKINAEQLFHTVFCNLEELTIFKPFISTQELREIVQWISKRCYKLKTLSIYRTYTNDKSADEQLTPLLNCQCLQSLHLSDNISVGDELGAQLANDIETLRQFGNSTDNQLGFTCGPLFLRSLVEKASKGVRVTLMGGPSRREAMKIIQPIKLPLNFTILPFTCKPKPVPRVSQEKPVKRKSQRKAKFWFW